MIRCAGLAATDDCADATLEEVESAFLFVLGFSTDFFSSKNFLGLQKNALGFKRNVKEIQSNF